VADELNKTPTGNNPVPPTEFPLPSLRQFLTPDTTVKYRTFEARSLAHLDAQVNQWIKETQNIVAVVGPITRIDRESHAQYLLGVTYVPASEGVEHV